MSTKDDITTNRPMIVIQHDSQVHDSTVPKISCEAVYCCPKQNIFLSKVFANDDSTSVWHTPVAAARTYGLKE